MLRALHWTRPGFEKEVEHTIQRRYGVINEAIGKLPERKRDYFERALLGVYNFDDTHVRRARQLQADDKIEDAKSAYAQAISEANGKLQAIIESGPYDKETSAKLHPVKAQLEAVINLVTAVLHDLNAATADVISPFISKAAFEYSKVFTGIGYLIAWPTEVTEDVAQALFDNEETSALYISEVLNQIKKLLDGECYKEDIIRDAIDLVTTLEPHIKLKVWNGSKNTYDLCRPENRKDIYTILTFAGTGATQEDVLYLVYLNGEDISYRKLASSNVEKGEHLYLRDIVESGDSFAILFRRGKDFQGAENEEYEISKEELGLH